MKTLLEIIFGIILFPLFILLALTLGTIKTYKIYHSSFVEAFKGEQYEN